MPTVFRWMGRATGLIVLLAALLAPLTAPSTLWAAPGDEAADDAHGQTPAGETDQAIHQPSAAVTAERTRQVWTAQGMAPNSIALSFDPQGNLYVVQVGRAGQENGQAVLDQRWPGLRQNDGIINDLQKTSVEDRAAEIEKLIANGTFTREDFTTPSDSVIIVRDSDGDGVADESEVFAGSFNDELDGIAAGVLWHDGKVYLTNIPHLWLLQDLDGDGDADEETQGERVSLSYGYGIRWAFYGHDMHGLTLGPDGRIYFSMADRGYNVTTKEGKHLYGPDRGAVFRMWPDGSELELYFQGLRNPQELAFDNYGNLFTGDNNSDAKDEQARFVYLPEGGDSGWRQDVQSLDPHRGPWMREAMWQPRMGKDDPTQPAWILSPIANVGRGPSGIAHYPGTGDAFAPNGSFLLCDFPAGVRHVRIEPDGATFRVVEDSPFINGQWITDLTWGYDGRLYVADWGASWSSNPNGNIFTMTNDAVHQNPSERAVIDEVQSLFKNGFVTLGPDKLIELLGHRDQRVRLAAQYELAGHVDVDSALASLASSESADQLARVHAIWTLGMLARQQPAMAMHIAYRLDDADPQVRTQAAKTLGDLGPGAVERVLDRLVAMLQDDFAPARFQAAIALGKAQNNDAVEPLLSMLAANDNADPVLRHGGSLALSMILEDERVDASDLINAAADRNAAARLGVVLALRLAESPELATYLSDPDVQVVAEAARAIYDMKIMDAYEPLARMIEAELPGPLMIEPILRRAVEANVRLGGADSARRLATLAANADAPNEFRLLALDELAAWDQERNRGGVWGHWWPREEQSFAPARLALESAIPAIAANTQGPVLVRAREIEVRRLAEDDPDAFGKLALTNDESPPVRIEAMNRLAKGDSPYAEQILVSVSDQRDAPADVKNHARSLLGEINPVAAVESYLKALTVGALSERQAAVTALARFDSDPARQTLGDLGRKLTLGGIAPELRLDLYNALMSMDDMQIKKYAMQYDQQNRISGEAWIRDAVLDGGDFKRGKDIVENNNAAQCIRCHSIGEGPEKIGPNLGAIGSMYTVDYFYRALTDPSADIPAAYRGYTVTRASDGKTFTGTRSSASTSDLLILIDAQGEPHEIKTANIKSQQINEQSQMPAMGPVLDAKQARDVLAYLVSLQDDRGPAKPGVVHASHDHGGGHVIRDGLIDPVQINHFIVLPAFMLGVVVLLGLLLIPTVLMNLSHK